jgi:rhodanese-related sulfurtransferase
MTLEELFGKDASKILSIKNKHIVFVADNEVDEKKAAYIVEELGYRNFSILEGGISFFKKEILEYKPAG